MNSRPDYLNEALHPQARTAQLNNLKKDVAQLQRSPTPPNTTVIPDYAQLLRLGIRQIVTGYTTGDYALTGASADVTGATLTARLTSGLCLVFYRASAQLVNGAAAGNVACDLGLTVDAIAKDTQRWQTHAAIAATEELTLNGLFVYTHPSTDLNTDVIFKLTGQLISGASGKYLFTGGSQRTGLTVVELDADPGLLYVAEKSKRRIA